MTAEQVALVQKAERSIRGAHRKRQQLPHRGTLRSEQI